MGLLEATIDRVKPVHFKDVRPAKVEESLREHYRESGRRMAQFGS